LLRRFALDHIIGIDFDFDFIIDLVIDIPGASAGSLVCTPADPR
jgi:hypothetical protein